MALQVRKLQEKGKRPLRESNCEVFYFLVSLSLEPYQHFSSFPYFDSLFTIPYFPSLQYNRNGYKISGCNIKEV